MVSTKIAQERTRANKVREWFNFSTDYLVKKDRVFGQFVKTLRSKDEKARAAASALIPLVKSAKDFYAKNDVITSADLLFQFHEKLQETFSELDVLRTLPRFGGTQFLFKYIKPDVKSRLMEAEKLYSSASAHNKIIKTAGIFDFLSSKVRAMGRFLRAYPEMRELKSALYEQIEEAISLTKFVIEKFKEMGNNRATGDFSSYIDHMLDMRTVQSRTRTAFRAFFNKHISPLVQHLKAQEALKSDVSEALLPSAPVAVVPAAVSVTPVTTAPAVDPSVTVLPASLPKQNAPIIDISKSNILAPSELSISNVPKSGLVTSPQVTNTPAEQTFVSPTEAAAAAAAAASVPVVDAPASSSVPASGSTSTPEDKPSDALPESKTESAPDSVKKDESKTPSTDEETETSAVDSTVSAETSATPAPAATQPATTEPTSKKRFKRGPGRKPATTQEKKSSHKQFILSLIKMADSDPTVMGQRILAYSEGLEDSDPETSLKLLIIAEGLLT